jgi:hypothetical protein
MLAALAFISSCGDNVTRDPVPSADYQLRVEGPLTCLLYGGTGKIQCRGLYKEFGSEDVEELPFGVASSFGLSIGLDICAVVGGTVECFDWETAKVRTVPGISDATVVRPPYVVRASGRVARIPESLGVGSVAEVEELSDVVDIASISSSSGTACALHENGTVTCVGDKEGWITLDTDRLQGVNDVVALSASQFNYCAVRQSGGLVCWGRSLAGAPSVFVPPTDFDNVTHVGSGIIHNCLQQDQEIWCWGSIWSPFDGFGQTVERVSGVPNPVVALDGGWYHTCALTEDNRVYCAGSDNFSQTGVGETTEYVEAAGF